MTIAALSARKLRLAALAAVAALLLGTAPAQAQVQPPDFDQPHAHALLLHATTIPNPGPGPIAFATDYVRCVDLAGGNALRSNNHHPTMHTGQAGASLYQAGHLVVPFSCGAEVDAYVAFVRDAFGLD